MGTLRFNYRSQAIGRYVDITVVYPTDMYSYYDQTNKQVEFSLPGEPKRQVYKPGMKFQTIYLIHGGGDDDTLTYRYTNAELYAQRNHVMLVTPNIANSFGVDTDYEVKYGTFLTDELPVVIQSLFASSPRREDNFIVGYAMGGNVALGTAIRRPDLYSECVDMSGGIGMTLNQDTMYTELTGDHFPKNFPVYCTTFGDPEKYKGSPRDIRPMAEENIRSGRPVPKFHVICGEDEFIRARVEDDVRLLRELGYDVSYTMPKGYAHDFRLWNDYLAVVMDEMLPLKRRAIYPDEAESEASNG